MSTSPSTQRHTGRFLYPQLAVLILVWALNWPLTKSVLGYISPSSFLFWRFCGAIVVMTAIMFARGESLLPVRGERIRLAVAGIFQFVLCSGFATFGVSYVGAGRTAVLIYTMQLWALPLGWLMAGERITRIAILGGVTVFSGLLLFMNPMLVNWHDHKAVFGNALVLISAMCWALGACLYRRYHWQTPFWSQLFWQIFWSAVVATMAVPAFGPHRPVVWNIALIGVLAYNWLGTTVFCFFLWNKVLLVMQASTAGQFMSLIPVLALLSSSAINGEAVTPSGVVSVVLIVAGIYVAARGNRVLAD